MYLNDAEIVCVRILSSFLRVSFISLLLTLQIRGLTSAGTTASRTVITRSRDLRARWPRPGEGGT